MAYQVKALTTKSGDLTLIHTVEREFDKLKWFCEIHTHAMKVLCK